MKLERTKELIIGIIGRVGNPLASIAIDRAYNSLNVFTKMLIPLADKSKVEAFTNRLLKDFPDVELEQMAGSPEFIIALENVISVSLIKFANESVDKPAINPNER